MKNDNVHAHIQRKVNKKIQRIGKIKVRENVLKCEDLGEIATGVFQWFS